MPKIHWKRNDQPERDAYRLPETSGGRLTEGAAVFAEDARPAAAPLRTCLTFDANGEAAVRWWVSLLPDSRIERVVRPDPAGSALVVEFTLRGAPFMVLNAPIGAVHSPAASISVLTADQAETDRLWAALTEGGAGGRCGWVTDRFGVSWQIVPEALPRLLGGSDPAAAARVQAAMMGMGRIDIAALEAAHAGA